ncbi:hypothetical protein SEMRO_1941_G306670.1 [Seminavis robusta]|uniref:Uncharacterized protein n=1 Tax=Seminavis robusta TaxID=568900 RepID=A0A9N8HTT8_9STRA|nr:hypothetical protein SEMRO_1941_G306670.1 [Seminavis robusta]|eukprot:Sro1941_g306670.1 n/a (129) ;mRNA; r:6348-6734
MEVSNVNFLAKYNDEEFTLEASINGTSFEIDNTISSNGDGTLLANFHVVTTSPKSRFESIADRFIPTLENDNGNAAPTPVATTVTTNHGGDIGSYAEETSSAKRKSNNYSLIYAATPPSAFVPNKNSQ